MYVIGTFNMHFNVNSRDIMKILLFKTVGYPVMLLFSGCLQNRTDEGSGKNLQGEQLL